MSAFKIRAIESAPEASKPMLLLKVWHGEEKNGQFARPPALSPVLTSACINETGLPKQQEYNMPIKKERTAPKEAIRPMFPHETEDVVLGGPERRIEPDGQERQPCG